jgi:hypothetical protein
MMIVYEIFNYAECAAWLLIAVCLPWHFRKQPPQRRKVVWIAAAILVGFGATDFFEAPTHGQMPAWLWGWKILSVLGLLKCRYDYLGKTNFRWFDRTNRLALICLLAVIFLMWMQWYTSDFSLDE